MSTVHLDIELHSEDYQTVIDALQARRDHYQQTVKAADLAGMTDIGASSNRDAIDALISDIEDASQ